MRPVRHPDPKRWDLDRLARSGTREDLTLSKQGLTDWAAALDAADEAYGRIEPDKPAR